MTKRIVQVLLILLLIVGVGYVGYQRFRPHAFSGTVLQSPQPAPDFELTTEGGKRVRLSDFRGKIVLLFFGYTFCPDVCPTTMRELARAMEILGPKKASQIQVIMISVDPDRDTPEHLAEYVRAFNPSFIGLTGTPEEIAEVATMYGIYYEKREGTVATGYLVDHTASVTAIDRDGYVKVLFPFGTTAEQFADDLAYMLRR